MNNRREFLKKAAMLAGVSAVSNLMPESIQRALAIEATKGSTYLDAEHIVFLMQENRSFDHCFGTLKGVRGFNDPRAMETANGLPIFVQSSKKGENYTPSHLDLRNSKSTWMYDLPHSWKDMQSARNEGRMDNWLDAKRSRHAPFKHIPFTMGYYKRSDIPFYYAMADAFTVCDQYFCSSLTGTTPNRSYFLTGTVRDKNLVDSSPCVENSEFHEGVSWKTYPERLEEAGISWRIYQNELNVASGLNEEETDWLGNFGTNILENHKQYGVRFHSAHVDYLRLKLKTLEDELLSSGDDKVKLKLEKQIAQLIIDLETYSKVNFEKQNIQSQKIHQNAFVTNIGDPNYRRLERVKLPNDTEGFVPAGDIFYQFRKDVNEDKLPTVSWLSSPGKLTDHPARPWYGAWYVSEVLDILTKNPEIWKKTIFVLTYDENDGFFDHIPPFTPPHPSQPGSGKVSKGINTALDYVTKEQEQIRSKDPQSSLEGPIGLGLRVPFIVASPWTKGGWVNSEVFDHTSCLQFLEHFINKKTGKEVIETNISSWRRNVCGDLTSVFREDALDYDHGVKGVDRNLLIAQINEARSKELPSNHYQLDEKMMDVIRESGMPDWFKAFQEKGLKPACRLPYHMDVNAQIANGIFTIKFSVQKPLFANKSIAVPFYAIAQVDYESLNSKGRVWNFAVEQGGYIDYDWKLSSVLHDHIDIDIHGPNGYFRKFKCPKDISIGIELLDKRNPKRSVITISKKDNQFTYIIKDLSYNSFLEIEMSKSIVGERDIDLSNTNGWYDIEITCKEYPNFYFQYAGHIETGNNSFTDPLMAQ